MADQFACKACGYPSLHSPDSCDNPACLDNPSLSDAHKDGLRQRSAAALARRAEDEERLAFKKRLREQGFTTF